MRVTSAVLTHCSTGLKGGVGQEILSMCRSLYATKHKPNPQVYGVCVCVCMLHSVIMCACYVSESQQSGKSD